MINKDFISIIYSAYDRPPEVKYIPDMHAENGTYYIVQPDEKWTLSKTEEQLKAYVSELETKLYAKQQKLRDLMLILDPDYFDRDDDA